MARLLTPDSFWIDPMSGDLRTNRRQESTLPGPGNGADEECS